MAWTKPSNASCRDSAPAAFTKPSPDSCRDSAPTPWTEPDSGSCRDATIALVIFGPWRRSLVIDDGYRLLGTSFVGVPATSCRDD